MVDWDSLERVHILVLWALLNGASHMMSTSNAALLIDSGLVEWRYMGSGVFTLSAKPALHDYAEKITLMYHIMVSTE